MHRHNNILWVFYNHVLKETLSLSDKSTFHLIKYCNNSINEIINVNKISLL